MFGGLDLKGGGSDDKKKDDSKSDATAPAAASSAFSFIGGSGSTATSSSEPASSSAFSFMNATVNPSPDQSKDKTDAPAAGATSSTNSAFGFLSSTTQASAPSEETTATEASNPPPSPAFSFLQATKAATPETSNASQAGSEPPATSGFSFLSETASTVSRDSSSLAPSDAASAPAAAPASADLLSTTSAAAATTATATSTFGSSAQPTGSGVVFGGASATGKKPIKRRARTKVGVGANPTPPATMSSLASSSTRPPLPEPSDSTRDAADEATKRAEEFMHAKMKQQMQQQQQQQTTSSAMNNNSDSRSIPVPGIAHARSAEEDEILAAAKAAAEEAQQMEKKIRPTFTGLGGLFRTRSGATSHANHPSTSASSSKDSSSSSNQRPPVMSTASGDSHTTSSVVPSTETVTDRLQKEKEEAKRAMAGRQLQMMQEQAKQEEGLPKSELNTAPSSSSSMQIPTYEPITVNPVPLPQKKTPVAAAAKAPTQATVSVKTPTDIFREMMGNFHDMVVLSMEEVTRLRQQRIGLLEERFVTLAKERLAIQQKEQAEVQQMAAAEAEDFELADKMGAFIEKHERERTEFAAVLESIGQTIQQLDTQKDMVIKGVSKCFQDIQSKLQKFKEEQDSMDVRNAKGDLKEFTRVSKQLSSELERLEQDYKHIERDEKLVEEEGEELENSISEQSGEYQKMKDEAKTKLHQVEDEIEELRQQLSAKQGVAAELRTEIAGHEESILRVRVKFSRQIDRVKRKKMTIADGREEWELEKKSYERHRDDHESKVKAHSEALIAREQLLESLTKEIEMAETFESIVSKEMDFGISLEDDNELDGELAQLQASVVKCEAAVTESKEKLKVATTAFVGLEEEMKRLEARIPELEDIKKEAAGRRDFKAAGKASKEAKDASVRLRECQEEIEGEALQRKLTAEEEVKEREIVLEEKRAVAREKEKESALASMRRLADHVKRLVATRESVCGEGKPNSIQGVAGFVIQEQIKALMMEGSAYGEKYGGWDDLVADCQVETNATSGEGSPPVDQVMSKDETVETDDDPQQVRKVEDEPKNDTSSPQDKEQNMQRFRELSNRLKHVEEELEKAVAEEDFEKAADLDESLQAFLAEVQSLNLTDEEMEQAVLEGSSGDDGPDARKEADTTEPVKESEADPTIEVESSLDQAKDEDKVAETEQHEIGFEQPIGEDKSDIQAEHDGSEDTATPQKSSDDVDPPSEEAVDGNGNEKAQAVVENGNSSAADEPTMTSNGISATPGDPETDDDI